MSSKVTTAVLGLVGLAASMPAASKPTATMPVPPLPIIRFSAQERHPSNQTLVDSILRAPNCASLAHGLTLEDCNWMTQIGMADQGVNPTSNNGLIWIGDDGEYTFTFTNDASYPGVQDVPLTVIIWNFPPGDYEASFMNVRQPQISYSLPRTGDSVTISVARDVSGAFGALHGRTTTLSQWGQLYNTWGEFTTGEWATVDVSRLVNMGGNDMEITVRDNGCVSDMNRCSFWCKNNMLTCGESGTYDLVNCAPGSQPGATYGTWDGINPEGGCQGWGNGGHLDIVLRD
ncbi:hypothetical protein DL769_006124 [Monosporascus sp. CRB-8-3]|nr:hypothetical protein DL769_006124 [Monosporascus sp. CRB-8-3]